MIDDQRGSISVLGAGTMGGGLAQLFAQNGWSVSLFDESKQQLAACMERIRGGLLPFEELGLLVESPEEVLSRITLRSSDEITECGEDVTLVIESVPERLELKRKLFLQMDAIPRKVILASNTSSFTMSAISDGMRTAERTVGLHFFNPPQVIPAVEIHSGQKTSGKTIERVRRILEAVGKVPVLVRKEIPGFVINRLTGALEREVDFLLDEGVISPQELDSAVKASLGFRLACLGPMEAEDMIGLDVAAKVSSNIYSVLSNATEPSSELCAKVDRGELGIKAGRGWYDYSGKTREEVLREHGLRLLRQLALFRTKGERGGIGEHGASVGGRKSRRKE